MSGKGVGERRLVSEAARLLGHLAPEGRFRKVHRPANTASDGGGDVDPPANRAYLPGLDSLTTSRDRFRRRGDPP